MFKKIKLTALTAIFSLAVFAATTTATGIMPNVANVPTGWTTDRYDPASFTNVGVFQGRFNALGISIDSTTASANRPGGQQGTFYNTQGRQFTFSPYAGPGSLLSADLYIPASWANEANGSVRTDIWGVMRNAGDAISAYPIIGFTNYTGTPRFRVWDGLAFVDLPNTINYDAWNRLAIELMPDTSFRFYVNGVLAFTDTDTGSSVNFSAVIMQAYNFEDPLLAPAGVIQPYTAHWANSILVVDDDGQASESDCDSTDAAFNTIQGAVNTAAAGAEIKVCPGTYNESPSINKSISLESTNGRDVTTIQLNTSIGSFPYGGIYISGTGTAVTIDGFSVRGNDGTPTTIGNTNFVLTNPQGTVTLSNNRILIGKRDLVVDGEDSVGLLTTYSLTPANYATSLTITNNIVEMVTTGAARRAYYVNPGTSNFVFQNNQVNGNFLGTAVSEADTTLIDNNVWTGTGTGGGFTVNNGGSPTYVGSMITGNVVSNVTNALTIFGSTSNASITGNAFLSNVNGINIPGAATGLTIAYNRIVGNSSNGLNAPSATVTAENNWWGCNYGPGATGSGCSGTTNGTSGSVDADPWLTLTTSAAPSFVTVGGNATVTSPLTINSNNFDTSGGGNIPDGTPASFGATLGTVLPASSTSTAGVTSTVFTAGMTEGVGSASTTVDGQTTTVNIPIYNATCAQVSMPDLTTLTGVPITVPVNTTEMTGRNAISADFTVTYNPAVLTLPGGPDFGVTLGPVGAGRVLTVNQPVLGTLIISVFGPTEFTGNGALVNLNFTNVPGLPFDVSPMTFSSFMYNEGTPCNATTNGSVTVVGGTITGNVTYGNALVGPAPPRYIDNVTISGAGAPPVSTTTDTGGNYSMSGFGPGSYTRSASKVGGIPSGSISAYDSSLIAQHVVMLITLLPNQQIVADVSGAGGITSFDAALIARYTVLLPDFGNTGNWIFSPTSYGPSTVYTNLTENYVGLLMGDVSGNWNQLASEPGGLVAPMPGQDVSRPAMVKAPVITANPDSTFEVPVTIRGGANRGVVAYNFELAYDPNVVRPLEDPVTVDDTVSGGLTVVSNAEGGVLRVAAFGVAPIDRDGVLINLRFRAVGTPGSFTHLSWDNLFLNEDMNGATGVDGTIRIKSPHADEVETELSGRVTTATGERIAKAAVTITDLRGNSIVVYTDRSGVFTIPNVEYGQTYSVTVANTRYTFLPITVSISDRAIGLDIVAEQ